MVALLLLLIPMSNLATTVEGRPTKVLGDGGEGSPCTQPPALATTFLPSHAADLQVEMRMGGRTADGRVKLVPSFDDQVRCTSHHGSTFCLNHVQLLKGEVSRAQAHIYLNRSENNTSVAPVIVVTPLSCLTPAPHFSMPQAAAEDLTEVLTSAAKLVLLPLRSLLLPPHLPFYQYRSYVGNSCVEAAVWLMSEGELAVPCALLQALPITAPTHPSSLRYIGYRAGTGATGQLEERTRRNTEPKPVDDDVGEADNTTQSSGETIIPPTPPTTSPSESEHMADQTLEDLITKIQTTELPNTLPASTSNSTTPALPTTIFSVPTTEAEEVPAALYLVAGFGGGVMDLDTGMWNNDSTLTGQYILRPADFWGTELIVNVTLDVDTVRKDSDSVAYLMATLTLMMADGTATLFTGKIETETEKMVTIGRIFQVSGDVELLVGNLTMRAEEDLPIIGNLTLDTGNIPSIDIVNLLSEAPRVEGNATMALNSSIITAHITLNRTETEFEGMQLYKTGELMMHMEDQSAEIFVGLKKLGVPPANGGIGLGQNWTFLLLTLFLSLIM